MAWTIVDHIEVSFADGNTPGHIINLPGGSSSDAVAGDIDAIIIGSDTTVSTPSGFTLPANGTFVSNQGGYAVYRQCAGGEGHAVTVITSGNFATSVGWVRIRGGAASLPFDVAANAHVDSSGALSSLTLATGTLATTGEFVFVGSVMTDVAGTLTAPSSPVWAGATGLGLSSNGAGSAMSAGIFGYNNNLGTATSNLSVSWTPDSMRNRYIFMMAFKPSTGTAVNVADTPSGIRLGQSSTSVTIDVRISDTPSGMRLGQSTSTASIAVTTTDADHGGMRLGSSPASVTFDVAVSDGPSGIRLGSSPALVTLTVLVPDSPSGMRLGASPIVGVVADSGATDANPSGMRLGQSAATVLADVVAIDTSHAGMRLGESRATVGADVFAGDAPSGMRLGQSTATVVVDVRVSDTPGGLRLGQSTTTVVVHVVMGDAPSGMRLGLSPATVFIGGTSAVTVADSPSGMRLGQSPAQVTVHIPVTLHPTIFTTVGLGVIDAPVGVVTVNSVVATKFIEANVG